MKRGSAWRGRAVVITSGPTREHLDPIRFMTNASSGRMGAALARTALRLGARVAVVSGPAPVEPPRGAALYRVVTAAQMLKKTLALARSADVVIGAAAVSDWRFAAASSRKIKRAPGPLRLTLLPNPDIIQEVARRRRGGRPLVVGFALETHDAIASARAKLRKKGLDLIVANGPASLSGARASVCVLRGDGRVARVPASGKDSVARAIFKEISELL